MKAMVGDAVIAEATRDELISIEGNWYFPLSSVKTELLTATATPYTCPWKGDCQYFTITTDEVTVEDGAFSYPTPYPTAIERVGKDFSGYLAFWKDVRVVED